MNKENASKAAKPRLIAIYLPQFYPIPENDEWWGKGFTEWTNVAKAKPFFKGHYQPRIPADLGYYDLRVPEVREAQANLAREYGIEGFCYWHYWFAGRRLLERPINELLRLGKPDFPFCLAWANETWSGIWHGNPDKILMQQTYPGEDDHRHHFFEVLPAFKDYRYIKVDGKPIFAVYRPQKIPDVQRFIELWQNLAVQKGLKGIYFLGIASLEWDYQKDGFDGAIINNGNALKILKKRKNILSRFIQKITHRDICQLGKQPRVVSYNNFVALGLPPIDSTKDQYPVVIPNWDNTPRSQMNGLVLHKSTPDLFRTQLREAISQVKNRNYEKRIIFIKSWNEWAEGNYLEPDQKFGKKYLQVIREQIDLS